MLYYSSHIRIFNGEAFVKEKLLLLKIFNKYSIKSFLRIIRIINLKIKVNLKLNFELIFKKLIQNLVLDLPLFSQKKKLSIVFLKKLIIFFFVKIFFQLLDVYPIKDKSFILRNIQLQENLKLNKSCLNKSYLPNGFKVYAKNFYNYLFKSSFFLKRGSILKDLENTHSKSIFLTGQAFKFYRGSITPFYKNKYSWLISSG